MTSAHDQNDDWKGEHLIRYKPVIIPATVYVDTWPTRGQEANDRKVAYIEALRKALNDGLSMTGASRRVGISVSYASILNKKFSIGFPEKSWAKRRKGLIA